MYVILCLHVYVYGLTHDNSRSRPADVLVARWEKGLPAALDITVTPPLNPAIIDESCSTAAESRKHVANDPKCFELWWTCVPLAVETCENWGVEAQETFSRLASLLAARIDYYCMGFNFCANLQCLLHLTPAKQFFFFIKHQQKK